MGNEYKVKIDTVVAGLKPDIRKKLNHVGQQFFSFALTLAAEWAAGDEQAGKILDEWGLKAIGKTSTMTEIFDIPASSGGFDSPKEWWKKNLHALADGLLVKPAAYRLKDIASKGER